MSILAGAQDAREAGDQAEAGIQFGLGSERQGVGWASHVIFGGCALRRHWWGEQDRQGKRSSEDGVSG